VAGRHRILYIEKPVNVGGSITGLYELVRGLDQSRYEPIVLFYGPNPYRERFQELGVRVLVLSEEPPTVRSPGSQRDVAAHLDRYSSGLAKAYRLARRARVVAQRDWPLARRIAPIIRQEAVDLVHHNNCLSTNYPSIMAAHWAGIPQVCHVRRLDKFSYAERCLARFVDAFVYMSTAIERLYHDQGIDPEKGQVVYDAFDVEAFGQGGCASQLRAELGLTARDQLICNIGRLDWWKGQDYFLQAMAEVVSSHPHAKALLVGAPGSSPQSQAFHQKLEKMVTALGLEEHVVFTGYRPDVPDLMSASHVVVHSSSEPEPFGRVVVEAMLTKRPVVATGAGGVLDIIEDQVTGLLVPPRDASSMAEAIRRLLRDRTQAGMIGERAQQSARKRFSIEQHLAAIEGIYRQLLQNTRLG
jgi:glycosyltransferase involved in cell wall biosynthesis